MDISDINTVIALISAVVGGGLVKVIEVFIVARRGSIDYATVIREELRKNAQDLRDDIEDLDAKVVRLEKERDEWRDKYFSLRERNSVDRRSREGAENT